MIHQHGRFNRHSLFTSSDNKLVLDVILQVPASNKPLLNMLYGLFDGYWYYGVGSAIETINEVPVELRESFQKLIKRVESIT